MDIPIVLTASLIPDIDIIIPSLPHRGPTHSLLVAFLLLIPVFYYWRTNSFIYYAAYASHLIADLLAGSSMGRSQLLWPYTGNWITLYPKLIMGTDQEAVVEIILLTIALMVIWITKDYQRLIKYRYTNFLLFFPCTVVLMSFILGYYYGDSVIPSLFNVPHLLVALIMLIIIGNNILQLKPFKYVT